MGRNILDQDIVEKMRADGVHPHDIAIFILNEIQQYIAELSDAFSMETFADLLKEDSE